MRNKQALSALAALVTASIVPVSAPAQADYHGHHAYYGGHHYYRHHCGGGNGAVGTVAGGVGGAVIGHSLGGGTAGTVLGGVGGALLGRHLDKQNTRHRRGC